MAVNSSFFSLFYTLFVLLSTYIFVLPLVEGFSIDFIHRDNPKSPYHKPTNSRYERLQEAFLRSFWRAEYFKTRILHAKQRLDSSPDPIQSFITSTGGEYLMETSIGTPPFQILAIADTGSDLTWTQCKPCSQCYKQDAPLFDPRRSRTFRKLSCESQQCVDAGQSSCDDSNNCQYQYSYGDSSYTIGDLAAETFTFQTSSGNNVSIPKVAFGCGHENAGTFNESGSGIIGLGGGSLSIVNQFGRFVSGKFSYCLVPFQSDANVSSKISFGTTAVVSGPQTVSTPLYKKNPDTFYYLNLEGISVGNTNSPKKNVSSVNASSSDAGNIIIDSGTTLTFLPRQVYNDLESTLRETISGTVVSDPQGLFGLCYQAVDGIHFPDLVVHFTGADVLLPSSSTFLQVSDEAICLTFVPSDDIAIFGNLSQENYHIGYDLGNEKLSLKPTDCTKIV